LGTQYLDTLTAADAMAILALRVLLTMQATDLSADLGGKSCQFFEGGKAREGAHLTTELQTQFQIIDRPHELAYSFRLVLAIAPDAVRQLCNQSRLVAKRCPEAVFVETPELHHGPLYCQEQPFGLFHYGRGDEGHVRSRLPRANY